MVSMRVLLGNEEIDTKDGTTVRELLRQQGINPETVIVARNSEITHENAVLVQGDRLDLVRVMSGG